VGTAAPPGVSVASLSRDIERLISTAKEEFARNIHDPSIQAKLKALLDLQGLLQSQNLPSDQLVLIKNQIDAVSVNLPGTKPAQTYTPTPPTQHNPYAAPPATVPQAVAAPVIPPASAPPGPVSLDSLLGKGAMAALLARKSATPQNATPHPPPPPPQAIPAVLAALRSPPQQRVELPKPAAAVAAAAPTPTPPADPMALLGALRAAGILKPGAPSGGTPAASTPAPTPVSLASVLSGLKSPVKPVPSRQPLEEIRNDIILKPSSLKQ